MSRRCLLPLILACTACGSQPVQAVELMPSTLSQGLVAYWPFDDGTGLVAVDASGNRRDGALTGGTWLTDGRFGDALRLGDGEFVAVDPFPDAAPAFSVSAWVRLDAYTQDTVSDYPYAAVVSTEAVGGWEVNIDRANPTPGLHFGFWRGPGGGDFEGYTCVCMALDRWSQIVGVVDGPALTYAVYVDGRLEHEASIVQGISPGSSTLNIGSMPDYARYLIGDVDDIAVWNRALVAEEVSMLAAHPVLPLGG
jgi:hypothetical protein